MIDSSKLKIQSSILQAVRNITMLSFDESLGDEYMLSYTSYPDMITMYLTKNSKHCKCFNCFVSSPSTSFQGLTPKSNSDISGFELSINQALKDVRDYIESEEVVG